MADLFKDLRTSMLGEQLSDNGDFTFGPGETVVIGVNPSENPPPVSTSKRRLIKINDPRIQRGDFSRSAIAMTCDGKGHISVTNLGINDIKVFGNDRPTPQIAILSPNATGKGDEWHQTVGDYPYVLIETAEHHQVLLQKVGSSGPRSQYRIYIDSDKLTKNKELIRLLESGKRHYVRPS